jgi:hypothetical protein
VNLDTVFPPGFIAHALRAMAYVMVLDAVLRALGRAFGPWVQTYAPKAYKPLAMVGRAVLALLSSAIGFAREFVPVAPPAAPPARVPPPPRPPTGLLSCLCLTLVLAGCGGTQVRTVVCAGAPGVLSALETIGDHLVEDVLAGTIPPSAMPALDGALTSVWDWVNGKIESAACPAPAAARPLSPAQRLHQAITSHVVPRPVSVDAGTVSP